MSEDRVIAALDIGSSMTRVVIAEYDMNGELGICGWGVYPTAGLLNGIVINNEELVRIVQIAVETAERQAIREVDSVIVSLGGHSMEGKNYTGGTPVSGRNREVRSQDIEKAIETATAVPIPMDRKMIRVYVVKFSIDDQKNIYSPLSRIGMRLDAYVHIVTASANEIERTLHAVERAGYRTMEHVLGIEASANAVLTEREKEKGTMIVNIGSQKSEYQLIREKSPCITGSIPVGGKLVTSDLADGFDISMEEAERIKQEIGACSPETVHELTVAVDSGSGSHEYKTVSSTRMFNIIAPRMEELFELIRDEVLSIKEIPHLIHSVVLTGGGSQIRGAGALARHVFNLPVRVAGPKASYAVPDVCRSPEWSTVIGLLTIGVCSREEQDAHRRKSGDFQRKTGEFFQWLRKFF